MLRKASVLPITFLGGGSGRVGGGCGVGGGACSTVGSLRGVTGNVGGCGSVTGVAGGVGGKCGGARLAYRNLTTAWAPIASVGLMVAHTYLPFLLEVLAANGHVFGASFGILVTWSTAVGIVPNVVVAVLAADLLILGPGVWAIAGGIIVMALGVYYLYVRRIW